ncbi:MAG: glycoside hydrolase family 43 protein [Bacteroidetes bacterium]|nr:glycoside hydrolase family 43 protein [Bacteroidota bacterium]
MPPRLLLLLMIVLIACQNNPSETSSSYLTYQNPIGEEELQMGDPFVLKHKDKYYLYGTTDSGKGFRSWKSDNLINWEAVGFVYEKNDSSFGSSNFWAPEVHYYAPHKAFYLIYTTKKDEESLLTICLAKSESPEGPFVDVYTPWIDIEDWARIDGHLFVDNDSTPYLFFDKVGVVGKPWEKPSTGYLYGQIYAVELAPDLSHAVGEPVLCSEATAEWEGPLSMHSRCNEGSFVFRRGDLYYMTYSANHYAEPSYGIGYATAPHPLGPWTKSADNPIVATDSSIRFSGPGHNSFTTSPNGKEMFMVYHSHADWKNPSGERRVNIDRVVFDENGNMRLEGPTRTAQRIQK